jgi:hypothetical protein
VTCIHTVRQRLSKHIPVKRTRATDGRPLLGNDTVKKPPGFWVVRGEEL